MSSKIKLNNNQGDIITLEHSDTISSLGSRVIPLDNITHKVSTIAELRAMTERPEFVYVEAYDDSGSTYGAFGSHFFKRSFVVEADNGGTVIQSVNDTYELQYDGAVNVKWFGIDNTGVTDDTVKWTALETYAEGKRIFVPNGTYLKDRTFPKSNTTFEFESGVVINTVTGGNNSWRLTDVQDVHFIGNGCTINRDATGTSANFKLLGAINCSVRDVNFVGGGAVGAGDDCIEIGEGTTQGCENIVIQGGSCSYGKRNGISVISGKNILIDGVHIHNVDGSPGAGIDVEANVYNKISKIEIRNCNIHDNSTYGIVGVFSDDVYVHDNIVYNNNADGIACGAGGTQFNSADWTSATTVARYQDRRAVASFNTINGWVGAINGSGVGVNGFKVGTIVLFNTRNGATLPAEFQSQTRWVVSEISGTSNGEVRLSKGYDYNEITSLSDAGTGTFTNVLSTTDCSMVAYNEGQSSNWRIEGNTVFGNNKTSGKGQINVGTSVIVSVKNNLVTVGKISQGIHAEYVRVLDISNNTVIGDLTNTTLTIDDGIAIGSCVEVKCSGNFVQDTGGEGININPVSHAVVENNEVVNCGRISLYSVKLNDGVNARINTNTVRGWAKYPGTYGLYTSSTITNSIVKFNDCKEAGDSVANSFVCAGAGNVKTDNIVYDGTLV